MKVISFSLWGTKPIYQVGSIRNAKMAKEIYPDFQCWFYVHEETVPKETIEKFGGKNVGSISSKTDFVLAGENMGPAKLLKATDLGIMIISEEDFLGIIE